jgi:uncharacterized protein YaeQ
MALGATMYVFEVRLADADRGVYETLTLRVARHPSETAGYLVTRLFAYCLEYAEGIAFSKGLSDPDEPAISVRDLTGALQTWIEIGAPDAARLHKAAKAAPNVAVYLHRDPEQLLAKLAGERIHRADAVRICAMDQELLANFVTRLDRRMNFDLAIADRTIYLTHGDATLTGKVDERRIVA